MKRAEVPVLLTSFIGASVLSWKYALEFSACRSPEELEARPWYPKQPSETDCAFSAAVEFLFLSPLVLGGGWLVAVSLRALFSRYFGG